MNQVRSSARRAERSGKGVIHGTVSAIFLARTFEWLLAAERQAQNKSSSQPTDGYRFKVPDGDGDAPISQGVISLAYFQKQGKNDVQKEMEAKTDAKGLAEFPKQEANKLTVSVMVKGYRSYSRWIRPDRPERLIRIRLEKWASAHK